jgi:N-acetylglutamate synthase-like GNAT family acetyltransferase
MIIKKSTSELHVKLTEISFVSKKYWNYSDEWMEIWKDDLTITENFITNNYVYHLENDANEIVGFYAFVKFDNYIELDSLFVSPEYIGKGFGNLLMTDFLSKVREIDFNYKKLKAEPFAEIFYKKYGFETIELQLSSKIENRYLPIMIKN